MFSWGNKVPLAEALGLNTLKYREARDLFVKHYTVAVQHQVIADLATVSKSSVEPVAIFVLSGADFQKKVAGLNTASEQELARILANVDAKLKEEKLESSVEGSVLTVKWTVPVQTVTPAPAVVAEKVEEKPAEKVEANEVNKQ
jgi:hypothetical protein